MSKIKFISFQTPVCAEEVLVLTVEYVLKEPDGTTVSAWLVILDTTAVKVWHF